MPQPGQVIPDTARTGQGSRCTSVAAVPLNAHHAATEATASRKAVANQRELQVGILTVEVVDVGLLDGKRHDSQAKERHQEANQRQVVVHAQACALLGPR